jgi:hypothetical protein
MEGLELWRPADLYRLLRDDRMDSIPSFFLDRFFTESPIYSQDREIQMAELPVADRIMAPFVLPTEQGKPLPVRERVKVKALTPPYIKPKNAIRPVEARTPMVNELLTRQPITLKQRFDLRVAEITAVHLRAIRMREAHMAAEAFVTGKVRINYERDQGTPHPEVIIDFGRDPNLNVVKLTGFWDNPATSIFADIQGWAEEMRDADFGGWPTLMLVGSEVASVFGKNDEIKDMLDTRYDQRPSIQVERGLLNVAEPMSFIGRIQNLEIWSYKDQVQSADYSMIELLDPKEILLIAPGASGVRAYGAIYNAKALQGGVISTDVFPSMWVSNDPSDVFLMHESAPLPIPLYPNRTLRAKVLED